MSLSVSRVMADEFSKAVHIVPNIVGKPFITNHHSLLSHPRQFIFVKLSVLICVVALCRFFQHSAYGGVYLCIYLRTSYHRL